MMPTLTEIKNEIKQLIPAGVDQTLKRVEDVLQPGSAKYNEFVQIKARYSAYLSSIIRGDVSNDEQNTVYNGITYALLLFIESLAEADLKTGPSPVPTPSRQGELLYFIPHQMEEQREYRCAVRVAYLEEVIRRNWQSTSGDVHQSIRVAEVMSVEMLNLDEKQPFAIRTLSDAVQFLDQDDYTEWLFYVKPLLLGEYPLILRVSVLEIRNGREVKKDVVIEEHIVVATAAPEPSEKLVQSNLQVSFQTPPSPAPSAPPFKGPPAPSMEPPPAPEPAIHTDREIGSVEQESPAPPLTPPPVESGKNNRGLRMVAFFFAFLVLGTSATWAVTPVETKDWVWTRYVKDDEKSYGDFIQKHPESTRRETAFYRKSVVAPTVQNLRQYDQAFPTGQYHTDVIRRIDGIELDRVQELRKNPVTGNFRQFARDFPESDHLSEIRQVIESKPEWKKQLMPEVEKAYLNSIRFKPELRKVRAFLKDFPGSDSLPALKNVVESRPELKKEALPDVEKAYLNAVRNRPEPHKVRAFLKDFPVSDSLPALKHMVEARPELKKEILPEVVQAQAKRDQMLKTRGKIQERMSAPVFKKKNNPQ
jgi:hypothetical protein